MGETKYHNDRIGMTARLDTMQAAVLLSKLSIFKDELARRQAVADHYQARLAEHVITPRLSQDATSSWAQYTIKLPQHIERQKVQDYLLSQNVPTMVYYPIPMHKQKPYERYPVANQELAITDTLCDIVLALPMHPYLQEEQIESICSALISAVSNAE